jgi:hypothetical protein
MSVGPQHAGERHFFTHLYTLGAIASQWTRLDVNIFTLPGRELAGPCAVVAGLPVNIMTPPRCECGWNFPPFL